jgi:hypothetical protein
MLKFIFAICLLTLISSYTLNDLVSFIPLYLDIENLNGANGNTITLVRATNLSLIKKREDRKYDLHFQIQVEAKTSEKQETFSLEAFNVNY